MDLPDSSFETVIPNLRINDLNDDCLVHIFEFVNSFDKLAVEAVCRRWQHLCSLLWNKTRIFEVMDKQQLRFAYRYTHEKNKGINIQMCQIIFSKCHTYLTVINLSRAQEFGDVAFTEAGHDCPVNLLEVPRIVPPDGSSKLKGTLNDLKHLLLECKNVEKLSLCHCVMNVDDPYLSLLFKKLKKLQSLVLSKYRLIGECFTNLSPGLLESVVLHNCEMDFRYFNAILPLASNLRTLALKKTCDINFGSVLRIAPSNPTNLLRLSIDDSHNFKHVSDLFKLKNLMSLRLDQVNLKDNKLKLIAKNCMQLRQLEVTFNEDLTDCIFPHINSLPHLTCLGIGFNKHLTDEGLLTLNKNLKELDVSVSEFSAKGLLKILQKMQCLEQLEIYAHEFLGPDFIQCAMNIVNSRPNEIPLTIGICGIGRYGVTKTREIVESKLDFICPRVKLLDDRLTMNYDKYV